MNTFENRSVKASGIRKLKAPEPPAETINLVFASDRRYLPYTAVTLASILANYRGKKAINVYLLLDERMPTVDIEKFQKLEALHPYMLEQIVVSAEEFKKIRTSDGISVATYYRLRMHELLPAYIHKALYLDSDLIIRGSIDQLFDVSLDGHIFAGVEDSVSKDYKKKFGIPTHGQHINAGVMLADLDIMRRINFADIIFEYIDANRYRVTLGDQQIIGELFYDAIKYVPVQWNVHGSMFEPHWVEQFVGSRNSMNKTEARSAIQNPSLIHYTLKRKPWISMEHPKSSLWFDYLAITPYESDIRPPATDLPSLAPPGKKSPNAPPKWTVGRFFHNLLPGYLLSIWQLRDTRLKVKALVKNTGPKLSGSGNMPSGPRFPNKPQGTKPDLDIKLKQILLDRSQRAPAHWSAYEAVKALPEHMSILSNVSRKDSDGGYAENIKIAFRTPRIQYSRGPSCDAVVLLSQRIDQGMFWDCVETAYLYDKPLFFAEVALFAGFASFFDKKADLIERRALGFILDDMGYYFDSRQPSRLERTLNDRNYSLTDEEKNRASRLIARVVLNGYSKYNKYTSPTSYLMRDDAVLVIDQKRGDASIQFSGATDDDFERMIYAAAAENQNRTVYFKRHPDSIMGNGKTFGVPDLPNLVVLPDEVPINSVIDKAASIYTISSQIGFEGLLRGKRVVTFGQPFYAGWGLTDDRNPQHRRIVRRSIEDVFHVACIRMSVYTNPWSGKLIEMEDMLDLVDGLRNSRLETVAAE